MPREITHWLALDRMQAELEKTEPKLAALISSNISATRLGAMAHDAPYYLLSNPKFEAVAELLHGSDGQDTLAPIIQLAQRIEDRKQFWAFLFGMVSHYAVDVCFHPLVYYLTGNYYDLEKQKRLTARRKHRELEVYIDSFFVAQTSPLMPRKVATLLADLGEDFEPLCTWLAVGLPNVDQDTERSWIDAIRALSDYQARFTNPFFGMGAKALNLISLGHYSQYEALFSFGRRNIPDHLISSIKYKNPVSGSEHTSSLNELMQEAVKLGVRLITQIYNDPTQLGVGLSLNFGMVGAKTGQVRYFRKGDT